MVMKKTKIGGIIQNPHLAVIWILEAADRPGIAATVLNALGEREISAQFIVQLIDSHYQDHICICIDRDALDLARSLADSTASAIGAHTVEYTEEASLLSIFGPDFRERPGIAGIMFDALASRNINILAISTSISTISCVIEAQHLDNAIEAVHEAFELP